MKQTKQELQKKLEPFIYEKLKEDYYEITKKSPAKLLTWNRLDLAFKLFYLDNKDRLNDLAEKVYYQDIKSQTLGSFEEFGNDDKSSFDKYLIEFKKTYDDIKDNGFDENKTLVPLSEIGTIINGAHRVASAIHLNKQVVCIDTKLPAMTCDYRYFYERNVPEDILDIVTQKFVEYAENTYIAFLWPSGKGSKEKAESKLSNIVYKKKLTLTPNGAFNLLYELYKHMDWVGDKSNGYKGIQQKLVECFPFFEPFTIVVFQADSLEKVREIKEQVRQIYNIGFSSIHITDTKEEALRISRLILNENGLHFLNYAKPNKFEFVKEKIANFKNFMKNNEINPEDILVDGSFILSLYGLREAKDIDFLLCDNIKIKAPQADYEAHDSELKFHEKSKLELIYNHLNYFYFDGLKFISFSQLYKMKQNRAEEKDKNDCKMMEALIENNAFKKIIGQLKQSAFYFKIKAKKSVREAVFCILRTTKLYEPTRTLYRRLRGRT